jgi:preprotein translocase SecE subunit
MATALEPNSAPSTPGKTFGLPIASLIGAIYTLAALIAVVSLLPALWVEHITPILNPDPKPDSYGALDVLCWIPALCGAVIGLIWFGNKLAGENPTRGVHGGAFLMTCTAITIFFLARAVATWFEGSAGGSTAVMISGAVVVILGYFAGRFFTGQSAERWSVAIEEQGWFSTVQYKRSLGVRVRRLTILGIMLIGGTGVVSLSSHGFLPQQWILSMPFRIQPLVLMVGAKSGIITLIIVATLWFAFRAVNVPDFAEFLIATEAEMNKVSWSTRKRLAQDTVVVLVTTVIMTLFLLVVDLFWGWLLSRKDVGVLPSRSTAADKGKAQEAKW